MMKPTLWMSAQETEDELKRREMITSRLKRIKCDQCVVVCDEADYMSRQEQVALLSKLDSAAALRPAFGGGMEKGKQPPVIWIFTCNGGGTDGITPPESFEPRFLSRCHRIQFRAVRSGLAEYLRSIAHAETDWHESIDCEQIAQGAYGNVRDALQSLEMEIMKSESGLLPKVAPKAVSGPAEPALDPSRILAGAQAHLQRISGWALGHFWTPYDYFAIRAARDILKQAATSLTA